MFCKYCGKDLGTNSKEEICTDCETKELDNIILNTSTKTEEKIEEKIEEKFNNTQDENKENLIEAEVINTNSSSNTTTKSKKSKSKIAAGLFGILFGAFGVHNFYLGYIGKAIAQLLITLLTCGIFSFISAIWGIVEGILILSGDIDKDGEGVPLRD